MRLMLTAASERQVRGQSDGGVMEVFYRSFHGSSVCSSAISAVSWSPSGKYVVTVDKSRMAVLWSDM